jgi:D-xylose transport system permease protein
MNQRLGALMLALLALVAFFTVRVPDFGFVGPRNLSILMVDFAITATLAVGMLLVILPGHIDLSAGSGVGLTGGIAAVAATHRLGVGAWVVGPISWTGEKFRQLGEWMKAQWALDAAAWLGQQAEITEKYFVQLFASDPWLKAPLAMLVAILAALILWRFMGKLIIRHRIPAFIITLGGLLIFKGFFWRVIESHTVPVGDLNRATAERLVLRLPPEVAQQPVPIFEFAGNAYATLTTGYFLPAGAWFIAGLIILLLIVVQLRARAQRKAMGFAAADGEVAFLRLFIAVQLIVLFVLITLQFRGLPLAAVILGGVSFAVWVLTQHTPWGRYLYAVGGNEEAAIISGIPVERVVVGAFTIMGIIVAITGLMQTAYGGASTTTVGELMELDAVAACVIGGTSLKGGRGTVLGVLFGALIMACLINGLTLLSVAPEQKLMARGAVLVLAAWIDVKLSRPTA